MEFIVLFDYIAFNIMTYNNKDKCFAVWFVTKIKFKYVIFCNGINVFNI
jgi:hypothetical protein